jgi:hypothetical protein
VPISGVHPSAARPRILPGLRGFGVIVVVSDHGGEACDALIRSAACAARLAQPSAESGSLRRVEILTRRRELTVEARAR